MRNIKSLVLRLMVVGNRVLFIPEVWMLENTWQPPILKATLAIQLGN